MRCVFSALLYILTSLHGHNTCLSRSPQGREDTRADPVLERKAACPTLQTLVVLQETCACLKVIKCSVAVVVHLPCLNPHCIKIGNLKMLLSFFINHDILFMSVYLVHTLELHCILCLSKDLNHVSVYVHLTLCLF